MRGRRGTLLRVERGGWVKMWKFGAGVEEVVQGRGYYRGRDGDHGREHHDASHAPRRMAGKARRRCATRGRKGSQRMNRWIGAGGLGSMRRSQVENKRLTIILKGWSTLLGRGWVRRARGGTRKRGGGAVQWWRTVEKNRQRLGLVAGTITLSYYITF